MSDSNAETLRSYEAHVQDYIDGTSQTVSGASKDWLDAALSGLPAEARILELGSAFGRDAAYITSRGFTVDCTDAVEGFVSRLRQQGFAARRFNALTDELDGRYDLIVANAVMLHFDGDEFVLVLRKLCQALKPGGRFAFTLKQGDGEAWSTEKIGAPRFFRYWRKAGLDLPLGDAGFSRWEIAEIATARAHPDWLQIIAHVL